ncbi:31192_t:CDS:2 [Gigaspora margarita]|uniref:31192_t:CDS:1 n=1 Tax=Gigaspora margarita TaxID=4874 RepID=A0ABN7VN35_GIGMA|nr:31192_t:CDS:2 [Gigaspora margarita]
MNKENLYILELTLDFKAQRCVILGDFNMNLDQGINLDPNKQDRKEKKKQIAQLLRGKRIKPAKKKLSRKQENKKEKTRDRYGNIQSDVLDHYILKNKTLDKLWDIIKSSIKKSAANKLPQKKKTRVVEDISYTDAENKKLKKDIQTLGK